MGRMYEPGNGLIIVVLACTTFFGISGGSVRPSAAQDKSREDRIAVRDALRKGGLREAAKLKGNYVEEFDPHWDWVRLDIETLTKNSTAVVIGRITKRLDARLVGDGLIFTDHEVAVDELLKGNVKRAKTIVVTLPGGRINFAEGTSAELTTPTLDPIRIGGAHILFLSDNEDKSSNVFFLVGGPQGLVDMEGSNVKSYGRPGDPVAVQAKNTTKESFLKEVRRATKKWPRPGRCCY